MTKDIAIIGDQFMLSDIFEKAILEACGDRVQCRKLDFGWPDEPIEQGYTEPRIEGLREYQGDPEVVIEHIGDAPVLVTHHAPVSAAMMDRMPQLRLIAVARGGRSMSISPPRGNAVSPSSIRRGAMPARWPNSRLGP